MVVANVLVRQPEYAASILWAVLGSAINRGVCTMLAKV